jgi:hypothetical protein
MPADAIAIGDGTASIGVSHIPRLTHLHKLETDLPLGTLKDISPRHHFQRGQASAEQ